MLSDNSIDTDVCKLIVTVSNVSLKKIFNFTRLGHEDAKADFATVPLNSETY